MPPLIHAGVAHAQFETVHPFLDGNGRIGRLLITLLLCIRGVLGRPLLYLSHFLKRHRAEYYDRLKAVRTDGAWEPWLKFFLRGVHDVATEANATARKILDLRHRVSEQARGEGKAGATLLRILDLLFEQPVVTVQTVATKLDLSQVTVNKSLARFQELRILREVTGYRRNRRFMFSAYVDLFASESPPAIAPSP